MKINRERYWERKKKRQLWFRQFLIIPQYIIIILSFGFISPDWEYKAMINDMKDNIEEERKYRNFEFCK